MDMGMWRKEVCDGLHFIVKGCTRVQRMVIDGETELGSDHNLMWCVVRYEKAEKVTQEEG